MAIEAKRDRIDSMRREGYTEAEIKKKELRRGCVPWLLGATALGAFYVFGGSSGDEQTATNDQMEEAEFAEPDFKADQPAFVTPQPDFEPKIVESEPASEVEPEPEPEMIFESREVVQELPSQGEVGSED